LTKKATVLYQVLVNASTKEQAPEIYL